MADSNHAGQSKDERQRTEKNVNQPAPDQQNQQKPNVCRRLNFEDERLDKEADEVEDFLHLSSEELGRQRQRAIDRWNFDFENEIPLDGDWEWEKVPVEAMESKEVVSSMEKNRAENRTV
ncbi:hypothetical protein NQ317_006076 [Molorchus minor]|uniref:Cyclin-dependent kinase inhibitor domain-containing protein n=1 Tax=Molorchus minor TaxID=1323400 RepID=A0ABQ9K379_9CUCU|nr:hypothetical protein NQ317_006076 [Molorchus minor]